LEYCFRFFEQFEEIVDFLGIIGHLFFFGDEDDLSIGGVEFGELMLVHL